MQKRPYQYIFDLLDFADDIANRISPTEEDKEMYFITLVYVEDILDKYGRGFVAQSAREAGLSQEDVANFKDSANERMDTLRSIIGNLVKQYDFDKALDGKSEQFKREWRKTQLRGNDSPPIPW